MSPLPNDVMKRFALLLQDEEIDVYVLSLYCMNSEDLDYFSATDRDRIKEIFEILMKDTKRHAELLKTILGTGKA